MIKKTIVVLDRSEIVALIETKLGLKFNWTKLSSVGFRGGYKNE
jgi:hypothetical protein|tara:strand:- start:764 stop:895 length:132 start_codon:yes stop_codon:yes gene_type:complete